MKTLVQVREQLLAGLNGEDFETYVDLVNEFLYGRLENDDELNYVKNTEEYLWETIENMGALEFTHYVMGSNYEPYAEFVRVGSFDTMDYDELRDLYVKKLFSGKYIALSAIMLATIANKLEELEPEKEQEDATQMIREQIVDLLDLDDSDEVILALLPVLETNSEYDYYLPHDEDSLEYLLKNVFRNDLMAFTNWVTSDAYSKSSYLNIIDSYKIVCVNSLEVYEDLRCYVQTCPDEELDEMIAVLDDLQLW